MTFKINLIYFRLSKLSNYKCKWKKSNHSNCNSKIINSENLSNQIPKNIKLILVKSKMLKTSKISPIFSTLLPSLPNNSKLKLTDAALKSARKKMNWKNSKKYFQWIFLIIDFYTLYCILFNPNKIS